VLLELPQPRETVDESHFAGPFRNSSARCPRPLPLVIGRES
jgi:hypothetical protein